MASYEKRTWWTRHNLTERLRDPEFLEAVVGAAFLVAASDGSQSDVEYDALLDRLEILGGVDRDRIDELLTAVSHDVEARGFDPATARVAEMIANRAEAEAALMVGLAVALADDVVTDDERATAQKLAVALDVADLDLDAMLAEIRG